MYKKNVMAKTQLNVNASKTGETIESKVRRILLNKEPITDGAELTYTERKDGVRPEYNIRTDTMEIAVEKMDAVSKTHAAKREERMKLGEEAKNNMKKEEKTETKNIGKPESTGGTDSK